ncbi:hypothetical protein D9597_21125 [Escherichia sp. E13S3]|nr:hypothetical protein D9597_21125 [Escherichia sp. E13S3]
MFVTATLQSGFMRIPTEEEYVMSRTMIIENQSQYVEMKSNTSPLFSEDAASTIAMKKALFLGRVYGLNIIWQPVFPEDIVY